MGNQNLLLHVQCAQFHKRVAMDTNLAIAAFAATLSFVFMVWAIGRTY